MNFRKLILVLPLSLILNGLLINAQTENGLFSPQNRLLFGNHLFEQKDYIRAIDEFLVVMQHERNDTLQFKIAFAYQTIGEYDVSNDYFRGLFFSDSFGEQSILEYCKNNFFLLSREEYSAFVDESKILSESSISNVESLRNLSNLSGGFLPSDSLQFIKPFDLRYKEDAAKFYHEKLNPGYKSLTTAALLSAVIPGLGKVYTDNITDGLTGFLVTGVLSFLAYDNFRAEHDFRAWLFTGLAAYFYAGNIYGSIAAADIFNAGIKIDFDNKIDAYLKQVNYFIPKHGLFK
ncbi:MAG: hypothetical protein KKA84_05095 [Bacteroidetes bacterium]|nr:hypothetical protein [Bacteroidota bacterium]